MSSMAGTSGGNDPKSAGGMGATVVTKPVVGGPKPLKGVLTIIRGAEVGRVLALPSDTAVTLGRSSECTVRFDDDSLSRVHARIVRVGGDYVFHDEGSTNGSFVNDAPASAYVQLKNGDRVQLGSGTTFRFSLVNEEEEHALARVYEAAVRDGLTGVYNRKALEERLESEIAFALRHKVHLAIVLFDVDFFKKVNDTYGHPAGDEVLKRVAADLSGGLRKEDFVARYGGEEFVVLARGLDLTQGTQMADRMRNVIALATIPWEKETIRVTVSAGIATLQCCAGRWDKPTLLAMADGRLYQAKQTGRNRVVGASKI